MKRLIVVFVLFILYGCAPIQSKFSQYHKVDIYKTGDCVDRAVRIRNDLRKDGYDAEMVVGSIDGRGHCWVQYKDKKTGEWINIWNMTGD